MKDKQNDKQKVTLYVPQDLHHKLKVRAALDSEPMSAIAERAIRFYLTHSEVVDSIDGECVHGHSHQIHVCPECRTSLVMKDNELETVGQSAGIVPDAPPDGALPLEDASKEEVLQEDARPEYLGGQHLVPC